MSLDLKTRVDGPRAVDAEASELGEDTTEDGDADAGISRIGRFYVFRRLGEGGMGRVFLGYDDGLDRRVAIKLLHGRGADDVRKRMFREAQALARLSHPNVVQVYEVGDVDGRLYMAMEFVEGMTLRRWVQERTRPTAAIVERYIQAARGLAAAHRAGLLHRDFKPENAIVGEDGRVRVLDFGLARAEGSPIEAEESLRFRPTIRVSGGEKVLDAPVTVAGTVLGTPAYMPIEQLTGDATDGRSDQFSLCVALWEALHGVRPFDGKSLKELAAAIGRGQPNEGTRSRAVPRRIRAALLRGLAAFPSERWPTMDDLIDALEGSARRRRWQAAAIVGAAALALIPFGLIANEWQEQRARAACQRHGESIAATWNPTIAATIRERAGASDRDFATTSARLLTTLLDEYAAAWADARAEICREVEVEAAWTPELGAEAESCLEQTRWSFAALVDAGAHADAVELQQLLPAALDLARIERCLDASWLARRPHPPEDPRAKAAIDAIDRDLAAVRWLEVLGRVDEARPRARDLVARADALGWRPLAARARFVAGSLAEQRAPAEAATLLREGFFLALESGEDRLAAEIASRQVVAIGVDLGRPDEGALWGAWAQALIDREPTGRDLLEGHLDTQLGILAQSQDDMAGAERYWRRALTTWELALGPGHPEVAKLLNNLGTLEDERDHPDEARKLWERALAIWEVSLGPKHPKTAAVLVNLGLLAEDQGDPARALEVTGRALAILEETLGHDDGRLLEPLRSIGRIERERGELAASIAAYRRALSIAGAVHGESHPNTGYILHALGEALLAGDDPAEAAPLLERAAANLADHDALTRAGSLTLLARARARLGDEEAARTALEGALATLDAASASASAAADASAEDAVTRERAAERAIALTDPLIAAGMGAAILPHLERAIALGHERGEPLAGDARFALARALAASGGPRERIEALLLQAALDYAGLKGEAGLDRVAALRRWRSASGSSALAGPSPAEPPPSEPPRSP